MPFAQNPSTAPSSSAFAAAVPKETPAPALPGTGPIVTSRSGSTPASASRRFRPSTGRGADPQSLEGAQVPARGAQVAAQDQEPVHVLRQRAKEPAAAPVPERVERG